MTTGRRYDFLLKQMQDREAGGEEPESADQELEAAGKDGQTLESRVETEESRELTPEHASQESRIEGEEISGPESRVETEESRVESLDSIVKTEESRTSVSDPIVKSLDNTALEEAIKEASKKPKLGVYSPLAAAMLRYKAITTPRYSMGSELRVVIEQALKEAYPQLYDEVRKRMEEG